MRNTIRTSVVLVTILLLPLLVLVAQETSALLIAGQQGQARVIQVQGKTYVEVEGLARITRASSTRSSQSGMRIAALRGESNHFDFARRPTARSGADADCSA
jgi:hypothetical protein